MQFKYMHSPSITKMTINECLTKINTGKQYNAKVRKDKFCGEMYTAIDRAGDLNVMFYRSPVICLMLPRFEVSMLHITRLLVQCSFTKDLLKIYYMSSVPKLE